MTHQLSVGRILKRDWPSFACLVFICIWWVLTFAGYLLVALSDSDNKDGWLIANIFGVSGIAITVILGTVIVWRVHIIRQVFRSGKMVQGEVLGVGENSENIGYALVAYQYLGRQYLVRNVTEGTAGRGGLTPGATVDIVVDPGKPARAFIAKLYLDG